MFGTVLAGFLVFVTGQFFLKLVLDPIVEFKRSLGELSAFFLREQVSITTANASPETQKKLLRLSSAIIANKQAIPFYCCFGCLHLLPSNENIILSTKALNSIAIKVSLNSAKTSSAIEIMADTLVIREMKKVQDYLSILAVYPE